MAGRIRKKFLANRVVVGIEDRETEAAKGFESRLTVLVENRLPNEHLGSVRGRRVFRAEENRGTDKAPVVGRDEKERPTDDADEIVLDELIDARPGNRKVRIHDPVVPDNLDVIERPSEAHKVQPSLKHVVLRELGERNSSSKHEPVVPIALITTAGPRLAHMTRCRGRTAAGIKIGLLARVHVFRLIEAGAVVLPSANSVLHSAGADLGRYWNILKHLQVGEVGAANRP